MWLVILKPYQTLNSDLGSKTVGLLLTRLEKIDVLSGHRQLSKGDWRRSSFVIKGSGSISRCQICWFKWTNGNADNWDQIAQAWSLFASLASGCRLHPKRVKRRTLSGLSRRCCIKRLPPWRPIFFDVPALNVHPCTTALPLASMPVIREYWSSFRRLMKQTWCLILLMWF